MTLQILERSIPRKESDLEVFSDSSLLTTAMPDILVDIGYHPEEEIGVHPDTLVRDVDDRDELGRLILESAVSSEGASFAVKSRSTWAATRFATPLRSILLTLSSGFGGVSATISPALLLHTYPAMDALVAELDASNASGLWQPIGERSLSMGEARHLFVSVDRSVGDGARRFRPNVLVEVVGAHLISEKWFDDVVKPKCSDDRVTFVFYGQHGMEGSVFERAWHDSSVLGVI